MQPVPVAEPAISAIVVSNAVDSAATPPRTMARPRQVAKRGHGRFLSWLCHDPPQAPALLGRENSVRMAISGVFCLSADCPWLSNPSWSTRLKFFLRRERCRAVSTSNSPCLAKALQVLQDHFVWGLALMRGLTDKFVQAYVFLSLRIFLPRCSEHISQNGQALLWGDRNKMKQVRLMVDRDDQELRKSKQSNSFLVNAVAHNCRS